MKTLTLLTILTFTIASNASVSINQLANGSPFPSDGSTPISGNLTIDAQGDLRLSDSDSTNYIAIQAPGTVGSNFTLTLPNNDGDASQVLQTNGSGVLTWASASGLGDVLADGSVPFTSNVTIEDQGDLRLADADATNYVAIQSPATVGANVTLTLPDNDGDADQVLQTNGSGVLTWADAASGAGDFLADGTVPMTGDLTVNAQKDLRLSDSDSTNWVAFQAPGTVGSNVTLTLPDNDGDANQFLRTNGSGVLTWASAGVYPTAEASCTSTSSWTANTTTTCKYRCVDAKHIDISFGVTMTGAPTTASLQFNMPSSPAMTINRTAFALTGDYRQGLGIGASLDFGVKTWPASALTANSDTAILMYDNAAGGPVTQAVPFTFGNTDSVSVYITNLPINETCI